MPSTSKHTRDTWRGCSAKHIYDDKMSGVSSAQAIYVRVATCAAALRWHYYVNAVRKSRHVRLARKCWRNFVRKCENIEHRVLYARAVHA